MRTITHTLSMDGHDLGELPEVGGNNWDAMWATLTNAAKATGKAGRWYLYCHTVTDDTDTWRRLDHFIEIH